MKISEPITVNVEFTLQETSLLKGLLSGLLSEDISKIIEVDYGNVICERTEKLVKELCERLIDSTGK